MIVFSLFCLFQVPFSGGASMDRSEDESDDDEDDDNRLLGLREVAERLGLSLHTVRRWASQRRLPVVKLGKRVLVAEKDLEKLVAENRVEARKEIAV